MKNTNSFEITGSDIAQLNDTDLRNLIGMLCEADYRFSGLCVSGIRYGGHQDAKDGGIDVMVENDIAPPEKSFVPRNISGFQVKKPSMSASEITAEMKPRGNLRPKIKNLIKQSGAYIIISSGSTVTETAYNERIRAMKEAVASENGHENLKVDFFDQGRIATWVRSHPTMILWVRKRTGREIQGWQPYSNWSKTPDGIEEEYILDEKLRLFDGTKPKDEGLSVSEGLSSLRQKLSVPATSVRLAGLSGVGKTRLVQALFDDRVGTDALNPSLAFYTDMSDSPQPDPRTFAEQLSQTSERAIVIVDNCPPELHRKLAEVCTKSQSGTSLLTVEYDVKDDIPEETQVFRLQTASIEVIEKIISTRYLHISQVDANAIANFSDGNARVAIALANTFKSGDTLSGFRDEQLFERFFWQRNGRDDDLLQAAEVCSLLYSFEGTDTGTNSELATLGRLIEKSADSLFRHVKNLKDRDLIQSRSKWRAVLPHAIANRLAKRALEAISKEKIHEVIVCSDNERLIKSFTRRLSYLHDSDVATEIVSEWLSEDGWIGKAVFNFNEFGIEVLQNIAPVCPDKTLNLIEKAANDPKEGEWFTSRENPKFPQFVKLLRYLAYEAKTFHRSASLIARFAVYENNNENNNSIRDYLKSLFFIYLSGTHASLEDRAEFIEELLSSDDVKRQELGLLALDAALEAWHFISYRGFSFGARPRDFGYQPKGQEILLWYETFIKLCTNHILSNKPTAVEAKKILAGKLRGLWTKANAFNALENTVRAVRENQSWNEGWIASNSIFRFDSKGMPRDVLERLHALREALKPNDLENLARTYALTDKAFLWDLEDEFEDDENASVGLERTAERTRETGVMLAQDEAVLDKLLPELVSTHNSRLYNFGQGLGNGCKDKKNLWKKLYEQVINIPKEKRQTIFICGFLSTCAKDDPNLYNQILDDLVDDAALGDWLPIFQTTSTIDKRGVKRLHKSLKTNVAAINTFHHLAYGRAHESIDDNDLTGLLEEILKKQNGYFPAAEILKMRFHQKKDPLLHSGKLLSVARKTLSVYDFSNGRRGPELMDYDLAEIATVCLAEKSCEKEVKEICDNMCEAIANYRVNGSSTKKFMTVLSEKQPTIFLESFLGNTEIIGSMKNKIFLFYIERSENPLNKVPDEILIEWCEQDPENHYPLIADTIQPFEKSRETEHLVWKKIVYSLFANAPDLQSILDNLADSTQPTIWNGSRADILKTRLTLFEELKDHPNEEIRSWTKIQLSSLHQEIESTREREDKRNRDINESFE
ncbi:MAG: hypothetical protein NMNS01_21220 [Nitrosomonas sp.]|nr:MAG: hypothetical protein NMNS01_21220 [Nitrosomonas sp.]